MSQEVRLNQLEQLLARVQARAVEPRALEVSLAEPSAVEEEPASRPVLELIEQEGEPEGPLIEFDEPALELASPAAPETLDAPDSFEEVTPSSTSSIRALSSPPASSLAEEELEEIEDLDDVEEIDELDAAAFEAEAESEAGPLEDTAEEEVAPESHSSPRAVSLERAFADSEEEAPLTPPPQSGAELSAGPQFPPQERPTLEQLGETISLEEGPSRDFELDEPLTDPDSPPSSAELEEPVAPSSRHSDLSSLEADLPASQSLGFDSLQAPPEARAELERIRLGETGVLEAHVVSRPQLSTNVVDFVSVHRSFQPETFAELVDASLEL